jgi:hypothetical protein
MLADISEELTDHPAVGHCKFPETSINVCQTTRRSNTEESFSAGKVSACLNRDCFFHLSLHVPRGVETGVNKVLNINSGPNREELKII